MGGLELCVNLKSHIDICSMVGIFHISLLYLLCLSRINIPPAWVMIQLYFSGLIHRNSEVPFIMINLSTDNDISILVYSMMIYRILLYLTKLIFIHARQYHKFSLIKFIIYTLYPHIIFLTAFGAYIINHMRTAIISKLHEHYTYDVA